MTPNDRLSNSKSLRILKVRNHLSKDWTPVSVIAADLGCHQKIVFRLIEKLERMGFPVTCEEREQVVQYKKKVMFWRILK